MNNEDEFGRVEEMARAWTVGTVDLSARVSAAASGGDLAVAIQGLCQEVARLRMTCQELQDELFRLRIEVRTPAAPRGTRITPYSPTESFVRLS